MSSAAKKAVLFRELNCEGQDIWCLRASTAGKKLIRHAAWKPSGLATGTGDSSRASIRSPAYESEQCAPALPFETSGEAAAFDLEVEVNELT